jgi:hypothetical protein
LYNYYFSYNLNDPGESCKDSKPQSSYYIPRGSKEGSFPQVVKRGFFPDGGL